MTSLQYHRAMAGATPIYVVIAEGGYACGLEDQERYAIVAALNWSFRTDRPAMIAAPDGQCSWTTKQNNGLWTIEDGMMS